VRAAGVRPPHHTMTNGDCYLFMSLYHAVEEAYDVVPCARSRKLGQENASSTTVHACRTPSMKGTLFVRIIRFQLASVFNHADGDRDDRASVV
jgi:hypothetical protein